jgi:hypothetical protein
MANCIRRHRAFNYCIDRVRDWARKVRSVKPFHSSYGPYHPYGSTNFSALTWTQHHPFTLFTHRQSMFTICKSFSRPVRFVRPFYSSYGPYTTDLNTTSPSTKHVHDPWIIFTNRTDRTVCKAISQFVRTVRIVFNVLPSLRSVYVRQYWTTILLFAVILWKQTFDNIRR